MPEAKLSNQELRQWKDNPITRKILARLQKKADIHSTELCNGARFTVPIDKPFGAIWTVGVIFGISEIFNIEADKEENHDK